MITEYKQSRGIEVYADNAATTKLSEAAKNAMLPYFDEIYANPSSLHRAGRRAKDALSRARETTARAIGADASEITFTSGGSEADNQAILSAAAIGAANGKRHIVSTSFEHHAVLRTLRKLEKQGFSVTLLSPDRNGLIHASEVERAIGADTALVSVMTANNEIGTVQPVSEIGAVCRKKGVLFHTDAVQAAGHLRLDVREQQIDLLSLSAHKFHGPKGVGVCYARRGIALTRLIEGGGQEKGRRAGTENIPGIVGLAAALKEAVENMEKNNEKVKRLREKILDGLLEIPDTTLNGDREKRLAGNIHLSFAGVSGESLLLLLDEKGIAVSAGSACTSTSPLPSHVLIALGIPEETARGSLRISLSEYNTAEEADYIIRSVREAVNELRSLTPAWNGIS